MSRYILNNTTFTKLDDPPGIVENISGYRVEIYYNPTDTTGVILYPYQSMPYTTPIWARREVGEACSAVVATIPYTGSGGSGSGNTSGSYYLDYDDDCCGGDNNVNISVCTHAGNSSAGHNCCYSDYDSTVTLPNCICDCDNNTGTATVPVTTDICDCNGNLAVTLPSSNSNRCRKSTSRGDVNIKMPIVINIPNYFPPNQVNCCPNGNSNSSTGQIADSSTNTVNSEDNQSKIDQFFNDKTAEDDSTDNMDAINNFFNDKEEGD